MTGRMCWIWSLPLVCLGWAGGRCFMDSPRGPVLSWKLKLGNGGLDFAPLLFFDTFTLCFPRFSSLPCLLMGN